MDIYMLLAGLLLKDVLGVSHEATYRDSINDQN